MTILKSRCPHCKGDVFVNTTLTRCLQCSRDLDRKTFEDDINLKQKGKVVICTIHERTPDMKGIDEHWLAVGKPKGRTYFNIGWVHTPGLAPTKDLVTFTKTHNRNGHLEGWFDRYEESLLDEWGTRKDFMADFTELLGLLKDGKNVAIACYCHHLKRSQCHLSVLRGLIEDMGYKVEEAEPIEYRRR